MTFFFYGPNTYALRQEMQRLIAAYCKKTGSDFGLERIDGAKVTASGLAAALQTTPFLVTSRLVIIEGLGANKGVAGDLAKVIKDVPESTVVIFVDTEVDRRTAYFKTLSADSKPVEFEPLSTMRLEAWVRQEVAKQGGKIGSQAIRRLIELAGEDQWRLSGEIAKLVNYAPEVTPLTVDELVEPSFSETIFHLVDALTAGRTATALRLFRGLVMERTNEIYILTMIQWQLRNLLLAKTAGGLKPSELAKRAGLSPYVASKAVAKAQDFSQEVLAKAFVAAVDCEYQIKSGETPAEVGLEQLIFNLTSQTAMPGGR